MKEQNIQVVYVSYMDQYKKQYRISWAKQVLQKKKRARIMSSKKLLPCPFCGEKEKVKVYKTNRFYWVECDKCFCCGPIICKTRNGAIERWNKRKCIG